jgi:type III pantothenate kinase
MNTLTIDIGNTTIAFGLFSATNIGGSAHIKHFGGGRGKRISLTFKLPTHAKGISFYRKNILRKVKAGEVGKVIICSVVPEKTGALKKLASQIFKKKVLVVGRDIKVPIINRYKNPRQVGQDRLVNAFAGLKLFGKGLILVDFGTAVTFDVVSRKGEYLGGLIFPGIDLSLEALYLKTALLPRIKIKRPVDIIGKDTATSMNSGIVFGMAGVCDEVIDRLLRKFKGYKVVATGGNVNFIKQYSRRIKVVRPNLTLEGLRMLLHE